MLKAAQRARRSSRGVFDWNGATESNFFSITFGVDGWNKWDNKEKKEERRSNSFPINVLNMIKVSSTKKKVNLEKRIDNKSYEKRERKKNTPNEKKKLFLEK